MTETTAHPKPRETERDTLTPEDVLEAAAAIVGSEGLAALTMRRLASRLGVTTPTIYWHVGNKQRLHEQLLDRLAAEIGEITAEGSTPEARIKSVVLGLRREVTLRPQVAGLAQSLGVTGSIYAKANEELLRELQAAGVPPTEIAPAMRSLLTCFASFFVFENQLASSDVEVSFSGLARAGTQVEGIEEAVVRALGEPVDFDATFEHTVECIVRAILHR